MRIVIEINDNEYMGIMEYPNNITSYPVTIHLYDAIKNGIPLPKGHGDLIDREELKKIIQENDPLSLTGFSVRLCDIYRATPIIEADKEKE